jgi:hypothetical protein
LTHAAALASAAPSAADDAAETHAQQVVPFLRTYCYDCHAGGESSGEVSLDRWSDAQAAIADRALWERVRRVLTRGEMPPADQEQPGDEERRPVVAWIDAAVLGIDCDHPEPGRVTIRRLNRAEYRSTIRDLLGVEFDAAEGFPVDPSGYGFDNLGDVLTMPPVLLEKYLAAAERVLDDAIVTPADRRPQTRRYPLDLLEAGYNARVQGNGWVLLNSIEEDDLVAHQRVPVSGDYVLRVRAYAEQRGERSIELTFALGDQIIKTITVEKDHARVYEERFRAPRGDSQFRVIVRRIKDGLSPEEAAVWKKGPVQNGAVLVEWLEVEGPFDVREDDLPAPHRRVFAPAAGVDDKSLAARKIISMFVEGAYRRPVAEEEVQRLAGLAEEAWARGADFETGVQVALTAVLVSPRFLYRAEVPPSAAEGEIAALDEFSLASRLSYFLWSSMPDEELFALARDGALRDNLEAQVRRMLADPKAAALVSDFAGQWLELRNLEAAAPDPKQSPAFDAALRDAMRRETELLFEHVLREDRSVIELLAADYTFVNERLAKHYGMDEIKGDEFRRVSLAGTKRRGLLTHASILTLTSNPTRTSPVKRGKWVLENLLASPPPPPPPNVPKLEETKTIDASLSLRKRMEEHRKNTVCASCHRRMDAIGFGLEHFDAIGAWRDADAGAVIDASGELFPGQNFDGAAELTETLAGPERDRFARCLAEKMLTYALGRGLEYYDVCTVDRILQRMKANDYRFSSLVLAIVESKPFRYTRMVEK